MENNAICLRDYFYSKGWSINAICGMLGNMETESTINPGIWESLLHGNMSGGYGLVQWTPASKYIEWAGNGYENGNKQCDRIIWEKDNFQQWISTISYPMSFQDFSVSTEPPDYLAMCFLNNYERPLDPNQPNRGTQAIKWYEFLEGHPPTPTNKRSKMKLIYYIKRRNK